MLPGRPRVGAVARGDGLLPELALADGAVARHAEERADPELFDRLAADNRTRVLEFVDGGVPVQGERGSRYLRWRGLTEADRDRLWLFLGRDDNSEGNGQAGPAWVAVHVDPELAMESARSLLRSVGLELPAHEARLVATAQALTNWHLTHSHCPRCGAPTTPVQGGWVRRCTSDGSDHFPRTDTAVIMSVIDAQDRLLLAGAVGFTENGMSVLAGFVEPGEDFADAVRREVAEEVGVTIGEVVQLAAQPWPFPSSLMIGFRAAALDEALTLQDDEIRTARWFTRAELDAALADGSLLIPGRISIARRLIEDWYGGPIDVPDHSLRG